MPFASLVAVCPASRTATPATGLPPRTKTSDTSPASSATKERMRTTPNARTAPIIRSGSADGILEEAKRLGEPELQVFLERLTGTPMKSEQVAADPKPPAAKPAARVVKGGPDWPQFYGGPTHNNFRADENEIVNHWQEKPMMTELTSGGFFVMNKRIFEHLDPECVLEYEPLTELSKAGELALHQHDGFWFSMDTYKEALTLNELWSKGDAPWKLW